MSAATWGRLLSRAASEFELVAPQLADPASHALAFSAPYQAWRGYYLGSFAAVDAELAQSEGDIPAAVIQVSVATHNLERLVEVLHAEVGDAPLVVTRIPERLGDLAEATERLSELIHSVSTRAPRQAGRKGNVRT